MMAPRHDGMIMASYLHAFMPASRQDSKCPHALAFHGMPNHFCLMCFESQAHGVRRVAAQGPMTALGAWAASHTRTHIRDVPGGPAPAQQSRCGPSRAEAALLGWLGTGASETRVVNLST